MTEISVHPASGIPGIDEADDAILFPPPRRLHLRKSPDSVVSFSAPGGVSDEAVYADMLKIERRVAFGHARRIINIDGPPSGLRRRSEWAVRVARAYASMWLSIAYRATFGRNLALSQIDVLEQAVQSASSSTCGTQSQSDGVDQ